MPAPPLSNTFDGGTDGVAISAANSGGASGDAFQTVIGTSILYSNTQSHSSPLSMRGDATDIGLNYVEWTGLGSITTEVFFRWYMWISGAPPTNRHYILRLMTAAAASCAFIRIMTTGEMSSAQADTSGHGGEGVIDVAVGQWVRMEAKVVPSTTVGEIDWRLYNNPEAAIGDFTEQDVSSASLVLGANIDRVRIGSAVAAPATPYTFYVDDPAVSTVGWIGPAVTGPTPTFHPTRRRG